MHIPSFGISAYEAQAFANNGTSLTIDTQHFTKMTIGSRKGSANINATAGGNNVTIAVNDGVYDLTNADTVRFELRLDKNSVPANNTGVGVWNGAEFKDISLY